MRTKTETAMRALEAALNASEDLPQVRRDAVLDELLYEYEQSEGVDVALILRDAPRAEVSDRAGFGDPERFSLIHKADIEWIVCAPEGPDLQDAFDAGLIAIAAAIEADRTLGGAVEFADLTTPPLRGNTVAGARPVKTAVITVDLEFTSSRPF